MPILADIPESLLETRYVLDDDALRHGPTGIAPDKPEQAERHD